MGRARQWRAVALQAARHANLAVSVAIGTSLNVDDLLVYEND
jgi:hypothetical protein